MSAASHGKSKSLWSDSFDRLKKNRAALISGLFIFVVCFIALFAAEVSPYSFEEQNMDKVLKPMGFEGHILGTDSLGRDLFSRIIFGARMSMAVGIITALISFVLGGIYGAVAGWMGGKVDAFLMRIIDILYSIPTLVLLILVKVVFDTVNFFDNPELKAMTSVIMALSVFGWIALARVVRGQVLQAKQEVYIEAARALGARSHLILLRHVFPNILGPIIVLLTFQIPANILFESFLSFIGLGLQPPYSSWGVLANEGWKAIRTYPHLIISPSVALFFTMLAFNFFGDGLRDAFDPKMRGRV